MNLIAKSIVKNKFWIVEKDGKQVATIQSYPNGFSYVYDSNREQFPTLKSIKEKYNITVKNSPVKKAASSHDVFGYPCEGTPFNAMAKLIGSAQTIPVYTKSKASKSYFCAGHYLIRYSSNSEPVYEFCPKLIAVNRYEFVGPFKTKQEIKDYTKGRL